MSLFSGMFIFLVTDEVWEHVCSLCFWFHESDIVSSNAESFLSAFIQIVNKKIKKGMVKNGLHKGWVEMTVQVCGRVLMAAWKYEGLQIHIQFRIE